jgi:hypothetical protein
MRAVQLSTDHSTSIEEVCFLKFSKWLLLWMCHKCYLYVWLLYAHFLYYPSIASWVRINLKIYSMYIFIWVSTG